MAEDQTTSTVPITGTRMAKYMSDIGSSTGKILAGVVFGSNANSGATFVPAFFDVEPVLVPYCCAAWEKPARA